MREGGEESARSEAKGGGENGYMEELVGGWVDVCIGGWKGALVGWREMRGEERRERRKVLEKDRGRVERCYVYRHVGG